MSIKPSIYKPFLFLLFIIVLIFSCKSGDPASLEEVLEDMSPKEQQTTIDPTTDNVIEGEKGTKIFIPANAFQFKDGSVPSGKVSVTLKEFFSVTDFASNKLSTRSDSFLLETGGMLFIAANAEGKELEIVNTKSYTIAFPGKDSMKDMGLFYGDTIPGKGVNWQPDFMALAGEGGPIDSTILDSSLLELKIQAGPIAYWGSLKINHKDSFFREYVYNNLRLPKDLQQEFCNTAGPNNDIKLFINKNGKVEKVVLTEIPSKFHSYFITFFKNMPPFVEYLEHVEYALTPLERCNFYMYCRTELNQEKYNEKFRQKYSQYRDKAIDKIDKKELEYYFLSATRLGWINCDRFLRDDSEKTDFIVKSEITEHTSVMIVFDNINSIMQGKKQDDAFVFRNMPLGNKIRVIGISYRDGKPLLSKIPATITKQPFSLSGFSPFSLKDLEKELNKK